MKERLRVLLVEDTEDDALLVLRELRLNGYHVQFERVETADAMRRMLAENEWDVVISDYAMPHFSGRAALDVLHQSGMDLPFIMLSGTVEEETAVDALRAGAHDFLVKNRLARLGPALERELKEAANRRARRAAEDDVKRMEEQVRQAQKMEAIGRLAGGVAHDFNNILTAIIATADLALGTEGLSEELRGDLQNIQEAGRRAAAITRQLLTFSRKQVVQVRPMDVNEIAQGLQPMLRRLLPAAVTVELKLGAARFIEADPTQIEQILLNLVINAGDAMPDGGTLTIETGDLETMSPAMHRGRVLPAARYVVLRIRDTGLGMNEETLSRLFEPFFTTKEPGRGTGLGLATVYGIVKQFGGEILVHSRPNQGTLFEVCLPAAEGEVPAPTTTSPDVSDMRGSEVVLVVEDEAPVRAPICRALRNLGYFVLEAKHGEDALIVLQQYHAPVHLLITDIVMPEMSGAQLVQLLHAWYPQLKVLFISGYSREAVATQGALSPGAAYLAKPFTMQTLAAIVRDILDAPPVKETALRA